MNVEAARREVLEVHQLLEDWFNGAVAPGEGALARFTSVLTPEFEVVMPSGRVVARAVLVARLHELGGQWRDASPAGRIRIERFRARRLSEGLALAMYEEWQDYGLSSRGRQASVVFAAGEPTPNGLRWLHLHETWITS